MMSPISSRENLWEPRWQWESISIVGFRWVRVYDQGLLLQVGFAFVAEREGDEDHGGDEHEDGEKPEVGGSFESSLSPSIIGGFQEFVVTWALFLGFEQSEFFFLLVEPGAFFLGFVFVDFDHDA